MQQQRFFIALSGAIGFLAVAIGAFGAHGLESLLSEEHLDTYEIGVRYHFYHVAALLAVACGTPALWTHKWTQAACWAWTAGIAIFSGSLYLLALTGRAWLGAITPIGGVALLAGWVFIALAAKNVLAAESPRDGA